MAGFRPGRTSRCPTACSHCLMGRQARVEPSAEGFLLRMAGRQYTRTPTLSRLLHAGNLTEALAAGRGPLPRSDAPGVREERDDLIVALRDAVLHRRDVGALWTFARTATGADDIDVLETLVELLPPTGIRRSVVLAQLRRVFA